MAGRPIRSPFLTTIQLLLRESRRTMFSSIAFPGDSRKLPRGNYLAEAKIFLPSPFSPNGFAMNNSLIRTFIGFGIGCFLLLLSQTVGVTIPPEGLDRSPIDLAFSPDGKMILTANRTLDTVFAECVWMVALSA